jgi:hypothetical protein
MSQINRDLSRAVINNIGDLDITSPGDGELLTYDNSSGNWINQTLTEAGLGSAWVRDWGTASGTSTLSTTTSLDLSLDVTIDTETTDFVFVMANINTSHNNANQFAGIRLLKDAGNLGHIYWGTDPVGSTSGTRTSRHVSTLNTSPSATSTTYGAQLNESGSGTAYADDRFIFAISFRTT